eukprot:PITA_23089
MVSLALLGLPKSWHSYRDSVNGREKLPGWERIWSDLVQEEIRRCTRDNSSSMHDEENCALASKVKKGKGKVSLSESSSSNDGKKVDKSKFELDFTLFACMVSSMMGSGWFLDSGASFHMTGDKIFFSTLEEKDLQILIGMGNDEKYSVSGVGTVIFQREHGARLTLNDVKYVPGLKRNLVSITMLEDRGYDVVFREGKVFLRHIIIR